MRSSKRRGDWWQLLVAGPCAWCGESFTGTAASPETAPRYCSERCQRSAQKARRGRFLVPAGVRLAIYERDGWTCQLCCDPVDRELPPSDPWAATLDHIVCRSWGGDDSPENLRLAHRWCNSVRGDESYYSADVLVVV
jgi:5-methylcytosine-specific restriction endonuclease McrA